MSTTASSPGATKPKPRLFITGASGYLGTVLATQAIAKGYNVHGLSRTPASDSALLALGATPVRGDLTSLSVLRSESRAATAVISLATAYVFGGPLGYDAAFPVDAAALEAMAEGLSESSESNDSPGALVVTSGTLIVSPDEDGGETDEDARTKPSPLNTRAKAEAHALGLADKFPNLRISAVRLAPFVYGRGGSGVARLLEAFHRIGEGLVVGEGGGGKNKTTVVHVDDAARLYLLAVENGGRGDKNKKPRAYNASGSTDVTVGEICRAAAERLGVEVKEVGLEEAKGKLGETFATFLTLENRASGERAKRELGWAVEGAGVLEEIERGSYGEVVDGLKKAQEGKKSSG